MARSALPDKAQAAAHKLTQAAVEEALPHVHPEAHQTQKPTLARLQASLSEKPLDLKNLSFEASHSQKTFLYLAYGSNLAVEKFRGSRGIKPLSQINVQVPSLRLTFDLPGLPYKEPCFANSGLRDPDNDVPGYSAKSIGEGEKKISGAGDKYRKDRWHKGMVGVVYEVTSEDYAHIIATEGGGSSYQDILVDCYPFESEDPNVPVPTNPITTAFKAHTLFAPEVPEDGSPNKSGRFRRPDTSYAQPSARYLKFLTDGAAELRLPYEYQAYLQSIRPYTITTLRQRVGQALYLSLWGPPFLTLFMFAHLLADDKGRVPAWFGRFMASMVRAAWVSYDNFFFRTFGDGERTIGDDGTD